MGLLSWVGSGLLVVGAGVAATRLLRTERPALNLVSAAFLLIWLTTLLTFAVGLLGGLRPIPMLVFSLVGLALLLGSTRATLRETGVAVWQEARLAVGLWWQGQPRWLAGLAASAALLSAARFGFLIWALPPFVWDSLSYHLPNVAHWIQVGRIESFEVPVSRIFNPANYEVLASWFAVFLHHDSVIEAAGLPAYLLAVLAVYATARGLGGGRPAATLAALAYGSTPAVILATTGTKNDIHMAAYYLFALAILTDLGVRPPGTGGGNVIARLVLLGLGWLLALGTKTYILHLTPGLLVAAALTAGPKRLRTVWTTLVESVRQENRILGGIRRGVLAAMLLSGLLLGTYWNARNWRATGNPFYPYDLLLAGRAVFEGPESEFRLSLRELAINLDGLAEKFGDKLDPIRPDLPNTTGWGWFSYAAGLPALGWALVRRPRTRPLAIGFGISFLLLMLSTGPSPWSMRFAIWFPALFCLCFAQLVDGLPLNLPRPVQLGMGTYLVALLSLNFIATLNYNRVSAEEFRSMLALPVRQRHAALFRDNMPDPYALAVEVVEPGAVLGYNVHGNGFVYPLYLADFSRQIVYIPFEPSDSCDSIAAEMTARGTRYLLVAPEHSEDAKISRLRACAVEATSLRERASGIYVVPR